MLPATRQRWHSRPYPSRSWYSIERPRRDARLSWPSWLVTYRDGIPARRRSPIPVLTGPDVRWLRSCRTSLTTTPRRQPVCTVRAVQCSCSRWPAVWRTTLATTTTWWRRAPCSGFRTSTISTQLVSRAASWPPAPPARPPWPVTPLAKLPWDWLTDCVYSPQKHTQYSSAVFTCIGALGIPAERGPSLESTYLVSPYSWSLRRLRQKISSIYCTVICNYPSAAQEQPFTVGLFCITKTVNR